MTHADDGALLRYLDGNCADGRGDETAEHLRHCLACRNRMQEISTTLDFVSDTLRRTDVPARDAYGGSVRWRHLAVAALIVLTATALVSPVTAWVVQYARSFWRASSAAADEPVVPSTETPSSAAESGSVSFAFDGDVFLLEVASPQDSGLLSVEIHDGDLVSATISGSLRNETFVVLPTGLRILNNTESTTTYSVSVPGSVSRIDVVVAQRPAAALEPTHRQRSWTLDLSHF